jgi:hypothetical protein
MRQQVRPFWRGSVADLFYVTVRQQSMSRRMSIYEEIKLRKEEGQGPKALKYRRS